MKKFVKRYRFWLILIVLILIAAGAFASMSGRKQPERTTMEDCRSLLADPETNSRLTAEQSAMLDAFSLLKGLTMIKYDGSKGEILNIELAGENYSRIKMFYLPHTEKDPEAALLQEEYLQAAYYEIAEVDENWYIGVHKPDKA